MKTLRRATDRGHFQNEWLKSDHSFSFSDYFDPKHMGFRDLRVINHDFIAPDSGFPTHPHRNMEIITYVIKGRVAHKDSMGNQTTIEAGEVQVMTAGSGITHSEFNPDSKNELELLQIWLTPAQLGLPPSYGQKSYTLETQNNLKLIASQMSQANILKINQDVKLYASKLEKDQELKYQIPPGRFVWLQIASGELEVNGEKLVTGDGLSADDSEQALHLRALHNCDLLLFDLN